MKRTARGLTAIVLTLLLVLGAGSWCFAAAAEVSLSSDVIEIGTGFAGSEVEVKGSVPGGSVVVVKVVAPEKKAALSRKGRVSGLWMTVEQATVSGMPGMYKVFTSGPVGDLPEGVQAELGLDKEFMSLKDAAQVTTKHEEETVAVPREQADVFLDGLIGLMAEKNLYTINEGAIKVNGESFAGTIDIPPDIPRGETRIEVYAVQNGAVIATADTTLKAEPVGLVRTLGNMAQHNAVSYGILAVLIALSAGITIAQFFKWLQKVIFKDEGVSAHH
ncbi:MAG: TIGR02186 family protein [Thermoanaerobacterales bacterium]|nr:TIGR02186 family protein [Bacillota bacterium]MDI6905955.1 TIGR02186 family protein [Thermoanaerobacterales bacterium]